MSCSDPFVLLILHSVNMSSEVSNYVCVFFCFLINKTNEVKHISVLQDLEKEISVMQFLLILLVKLAYVIYYSYRPITFVGG